MQEKKRNKAKNKQKYLIDSYDSKSNELKILQGTSFIGDNAFDGFKFVQSVYIPDSVVYIGEDAFSDCELLENIYITSLKSWCNIIGLENLMRWGARNKKLYLNNQLITDLQIPNGVTEIQDCAFLRCTAIESVTVPSSVRNLGWMCFKGCTSLKSISLPNELISMNNYVFKKCDSLEYNAKNGINYLGNSKNPYLCAIKPVSEQIKSAVIDNNCKIIYCGAFENCSLLESVILPSGLTFISHHCFRNCTSLKNIEIPNGVTKLGDFIFFNCEKLERVNLPNSITSLYEHTFDLCFSLKSITYGDTVKKWQQIENSSLVNIKIICTDGVIN